MKRIFYAISALALVAPATAFGQYGMQKAKAVNTTETDLSGIIGTIIKFLISIVGGLSVLMIVIAGIMYITSGGDEGRVDTAKKWLTYSIIGLVVALLAWVIVNTVITNL